MESESLLAGNVQRLHFLRKKTGIDLGVRESANLHIFIGVRGLGSLPAQAGTMACHICECRTCCGVIVQE